MLFCMGKKWTILKIWACIKLNTLPWLWSASIQAFLKEPSPKLFPLESDTFSACICWKWLTVLYHVSGSAETHGLQLAISNILKMHFSFFLLIPELLFQSNHMKNGLGDLFLRSNGNLSKNCISFLTYSRAMWFFFPVTRLQAVSHSSISFSYTKCFTIMFVLTLTLWGLQRVLMWGAKVERGCLAQGYKHPWVKWKLEPRSKYKSPCL